MLAAERLPDVNRAVRCGFNGRRHCRCCGAGTSGDVKRSTLQLAMRNRGVDVTRSPWTITSPLTLLLLITPMVLHAQQADGLPRWALSVGAGAGVASVPRSAQPTYCDASQLSARVGAQHVIGGGFVGGLALATTIGVTGSDCTLGPCAPQVKQHVISASVAYHYGRALRRFVPIVSLSAGVARLPEQWATGDRRRTPAANTVSASAALDVPIFVQQRTALLIGWETGVLPDAPGGRIRTNALVLTVRHHWTGTSSQ